MELKQLIGQKVKKIRPMTRKESQNEGWDFGRHGAPSVIEFEDGTVIYPSQDPEGNGPGAFFGVDSEGNTFGF